MTPHLNRLDETVQMRGYNIWFQRELRKIIPQLSSNTPLIKSSQIKDAFETYTIFPSLELSKHIYL